MQGRLGLHAVEAHLRGSGIREDEGRVRHAARQIRKSEADRHSETNYANAALRRTK